MSTQPSYHWSASDFERYYNGTMPAAEKHALEKAALEDPFLADALEGYAFSRQPAAELQSIRNRMSGDDNKRVTPGFFRLRNWTAAAAVLLLMAGAGWLVFRFNQLPKVDDRAQETVNHVPPMMERISTDSAQLAAPLQKDSNEPAENLATVPAQPLNKSKKKQFSIFADQTATIQSQAAKETADSQAMNSMAMKSEERRAIAVQSIPGVKVSKDSISNLDVALPPNKDSQAITRVDLKAPRARAFEADQTYKTLEPEEGWVSYNDYIELNLKEPEEISKKIISGSVELSFEVDKEGIPTNIKVARSLCSRCDEEAIRLLKEGPRWKKSNKKGKITIRF